MKPMLAEDYVESKLNFPYMAQPKIDGVRALHMLGKFGGRSLKQFGNRFTNAFFGHSAFMGLDGELAAEHECHPALCRLTTSALGKHDGEPFVLWWLFDYVTLENQQKPYFQRYVELENRVAYLRAHPSEEVAARAMRLRVVPYVLVNTLSQLETFDAQWLDQGYEGTIIRKPDSVYKFGRSTPNEGGLLRIKRFIEEDAVVNSITEGQSNLNEATVNALGQTERSSHQAGMQPNGMVGALECTDVKTGKAITVAAGCMPHDDRLLYFRNPSLLVGKTIKYKTFPKGVKDRPRFPTFQSIRLEEDK